jgi:hypothetical protein
VKEDIDDIVAICWDVFIAADGVPQNKSFDELEEDDQALLLERVKYYLDK